MMVFATAILEINDASFCTNKWSLIEISVNAIIVLATCNLELKEASSSTYKRFFNVASPSIIVFFKTELPDIAIPPLKSTVPSTINLPCTYPVPYVPIVKVLSKYAFPYTVISPPALGVPNVEVLPTVKLPVPAISELKFPLANDKPPANAENGILPSVNLAVITP